MTITHEAMMPRQLSPRQLEVAKLLALAYSGDEVAEMLGMSPGTVEAHRSQIYARLGIDNVVDLTHTAIRNGWIRVKGMPGRPRKEVNGDED